MSLETGLADRTALVTGAASGIGRAVALALAREGAHVLATDRDAAGLRQLRDGDARVRTAVADLAEPDAIEALVEQAERIGDGLEVLVCNAGIGHAATIAETTLEQWEQTFAVNARAPFLLCRAAVRAMAERGHGTIVNVSSAAAIAAVGNRAAYVASKAAVIGLTRAIAVDFAARGVRANCVAPGTVDSPWIERILAAAPDAEQRRRAMAARQIVDRLGRVDEIADAIVFLASDRSSFMHGATLVVDGGFSAR